MLAFVASFFLFSLQTERSDYFSFNVPFQENKIYQWRKTLWEVETLHRADF